MKIKFTALLILAMTVASMSVFTSCKDNCEDDYNELRAMLNDQNTKLTELINAQINGVKSEINSLKDQIAAIKSCTCDPSDVDKKIKDALEKRGVKLSKEEFNKFVEDIKKIGKKDDGVVPSEELDFDVE